MLRSKTSKWGTDELARKDTDELAIEGTAEGAPTWRTRRQFVSSCSMAWTQLGVAQNYRARANRRFFSMFPLTRATHFGIPVS